MSELDPNLKRLLKWARSTPPAEPEAAPFGFAARVLAAKRPPGVSTLLEQLQKTAWKLACVAFATIVFGCLALVSQHSAAAPVAADLPSAVGYLANNLPL